MSYQLTTEEKTLVSDLEGFRDKIVAWSKSAGGDERRRLRASINQNLHQAREIVRLAGCLNIMTIAPPPMIGGLIMRNVDPFNYIFEDVYGQSLTDVLIDMIDQAIGVIHSGKYSERQERLKKSYSPLGPVAGKKVFIVHGHDESARDATARFIEKLSLEPIVLNEQPNAGRTIIEKVEQNSGVAFAVVLLTPDDVGAKKGSESNLHDRARQNVILELGFFIGLLGRSHVAALVKGDLERPSDYDGVVYIPMDSAGAWKMLLAKELKIAGLGVDLNDVM